jgi:uncharacterized membrane protein
VGLLVVLIIVIIIIWIIVLILFVIREVWWEQVWHKFHERLATGRAADLIGRDAVANHEILRALVAKPHLR